MMKIIAFGDGKFKRIALNWVKHLEVLGITNYVVISLDTEIYDFLTSHGANTELIEQADIFKHRDQRNMNKAWAMRLQLIYDRLSGHDGIIHSDLDAVWLRDPSKFINLEYDIIASTGNMQTEMYEQLNLSFCMGWIFFKNNDKIKNLFKKILDHESRFDDQLALNDYLIKQKNIRMSDKSDNIIGIKEVTFGDIKTQVLCEKIVARHPASIKTSRDCAYVYHPHLCGDIPQREKLLKVVDLWCLNESDTQL